MQGVRRKQEKLLRERFNAMSNIASFRITTRRETFAGGLTDGHIIINKNT